MAAPLLQTKLYIPTVRPALVSRPRLIERLNTGLSGKLTLVSAPAGFGKTTLLSEWIASRGARAGVAWLSLDPDDSDLTRFLTYLIVALQTTHADLGQGLLVTLQSSGPVNVESILTILLNEIAGLASSSSLTGSTVPVAQVQSGQNAGQGMILVLDDYHAIESPPIDQALTFLLDHLPPHAGPGGQRWALHLVIATRADPTLPLSRLRARGQLTELRVADLRFDSDEAAAFLKQVVRLPISPDNVRALEKRTEGWITGLHLAALAMQGLGQREQISRFVQSFGGSHRFVIDYLVDEVLDQQTPQLQAFLLCTSILDRMAAPLCDVVTGQRDSQAILEQLEAVNLFLVPLDGDRRWYRYHQLFADLLIYRLKRASPDLIPELYRRASTWFEAEGLVEDAFRHARAAGDTERAAGIVEEHWQEVVHRGELTKLKRWLDNLGPEYSKSAPLSMAYCWIHHLTGQADAIPRHIQDARAALNKGPPAEHTHQPIKLAVIPSLIETMEAVVALNEKRPEEAKEHARRAIALIPDDSNPETRWLLHGAAAFRLAHAHRELGEVEQACAVLLDVLDMLRASQNHLGVANTVSLLAAMYEQTGKAQQAVRLCEETLDYIREHHSENLPPSGMVHLSLASLQANAGHVDEARVNLDTGRRLVGPMQSQQIRELADRAEKKMGRFASSPQPLVEPLSEREMQVLQLVAKGLSNREIGERLFLALDTVKGHNRRIYAKLAVKSRTQAVSRARALDILPLHKPQ